MCVPACHTMSKIDFPQGRIISSDIAVPRAGRAMQKKQVSPDHVKIANRGVLLISKVLAECRMRSACEMNADAT
jgi:hypothetical protein